MIDTTIINETQEENNSNLKYIAIMAIIGLLSLLFGLKAAFKKVIKFKITETELNDNPLDFNYISVKIEERKNIFSDTKIELCVLHKNNFNVILRKLLEEERSNNHKVLYDMLEDNIGEAYAKDILNQKKQAKMSDARALHYVGPSVFNKLIFCMANYWLKNKNNDTDLKTDSDKFYEMYSKLDTSQLQLNIKYSKRDDKFKYTNIEISGIRNKGNQITLTNTFEKIPDQTNKRRTKMDEDQELRNKTSGQIDGEAKSINILLYDNFTNFSFNNKLHYEAEHYQGWTLKNNNNTVMGEYFRYFNNEYEKIKANPTGKKDLLRELTSNIAEENRTFNYLETKENEKLKIMFLTFVYILSTSHIMKPGFSDRMSELIVIA